MEKDELYGRYNEEQRIRGKREFDRAEEAEESAKARAKRESGRNA